MPTWPFSSCEIPASPCKAQRLISRGASSYQFNPDLVPSTEPSEDNPQPRPFTIFQILLLSLAHQPFGPDFKLALALLSDQMVSRNSSLSLHAQRNSPVSLSKLQSPAYATPETLQDYAQLQQLQQHILSRDLPQVWSKLHALSSSPQLQRAYASLASLDDVLRRSLARDVLQPLFKSIAVVRFESWLNAQGKAAQVAGMLGEGWSVQGDHVMVPQVSQADSVGSKDAEDGLKGGKETLNLQSMWPVSLGLETSR